MKENEQYVKKDAMLDTFRNMQEQINSLKLDIMKMKKRFNNHTHHKHDSSYLTETPLEVM